jgi:outer membrane immunogenic protein
MMRTVFNAKNPVLALLVAAMLPVSGAEAQTGRWAGLYAGANAGATWSGSDVRAAATCGSTPVPQLPIGYFCDSQNVTQGPNASAAGAGGSGSASSSGFTGGIQAGYNWQSGNFVLGGEVDFGAFSLAQSRAGSGALPVTGFNIAPGTSYTLRSKADSDWLLTLRGRMGLVSGPALVYITAGLAMSQIETTHSYADNNTTPAAPGSGFGSASAMRTGWIAGGGVEWALNSNWTLKGEYLYADFGSAKVNWLISAPSIGGGLTNSNAMSTSTDLSAHLARAGVNYKF